MAAASDPHALTEAAHFGAVSILPAERRLLVQGRAAPLGARAFDLLLTLAARRERVVGKDELLDLVWPGLVVEENNLAAQISALRKVLGAGAIATIPGRGYRFTLAAAARPPSADAAAVPGPVAAAPSVAAPDWPAASSSPAAGARVLLADDNKVNRLLLCRTLELQGWQVDTADDGRTALERLRQQDFALLLLDLEMPELDGFGLLAERARDPRLRGIPVIVTSSLDGLGPVARCLELGADDYLHKPVNASLLKARVGACLERRQLRAERDALRQRLGPPAAADASCTAPPAAGDAAAQWQHGQVLVLRLLQLTGAPAGQMPGQGAAAGLLQSLAPDDSLDLLSNWHTLMQDALQRHGGRLQQVTADGLVTVFGEVQAAHEAVHGGGAGPGLAPLATHALQAVHAATEAAELLALFNAERRAAGRQPLCLGAGLATGAVLLGWAYTPLQPVRVCLGDAVARAQAFAAHAVPAPFSLLLDPTTQHLLQAEGAAGVQVAAWTGEPLAEAAFMAGTAAAEAG